MIYAAVAFILGFAIAWVWRSATVVKIKKSENSANGSWEREKLMKENAQKEVLFTLNAKEQAEREFEKKLKAANQIIKQMDNDILLLQKNNEETEALLKAGKPELHQVKKQLIEANNTIARYKAQLGLK
ncbi:MAG: hypothetical protein JSU03_14305 [Bacteroidetes bacterium]|nr:hypothetical protein [Bacteroidota bacterium]MBS1758419.1 hypothetical protein [Bacteroidota bacterium]